MPGNLHPADPVEVMPYTVARLFEESAFLDAQLDEYADGRSVRRALAINSRRTFRLTRLVSDEDLDILRGFYLANSRLIARGTPFWFYNVRETVPPFTWDETAGDPVGRYAVVWEGGWNETLCLRLHEVTIVLRQVA